MASHFPAPLRESKKEISYLTFEFSMTMSQRWGGKAGFIIFLRRRTSPRNKVQSKICTPFARRRNIPFNGKWNENAMERRRNKNRDFIVCSRARLSHKQEETAHRERWQRKKSYYVLLHRFTANAKMSESLRRRREGGRITKCKYMLVNSSGFRSVQGHE